MSLCRPWLLGDGAALLGLVERGVAGLAAAVSVHTLAVKKVIDVNSINYQSNLIN